MNKENIKYKNYASINIKKRKYRHSLFSAFMYQTVRSVMKKPLLFTNFLVHIVQKWQLYLTFGEGWGGDKSKDGSRLSFVLMHRR